MKIKLYQDAHLHLNKDFAPDFSVKIGRIFLNSVSTDDFITIRQTSSVGVLPFFGIHPWMITDDDISVEAIESEIKNLKAAGIGECGLDFSPPYKSTGDLQISAFRLQLELGKQYSRPLSVHCVRAWNPLMEILQDFFPFKSPFIIHSFYGSMETAERLINLGGYISISSRSLLNPEKSYPVIKAIPDNKLLIESDSYIGGNSIIDKHLKILENNYEAVAEIRGISLDNLKAMVWDNGTIFTN